MKIQELDKQNTEYQFVSNHFRLSINKEKGGFGIHEVLKIEVSPSVDSKFSLSSNCKRMYLPVSRGNISQIVKSPIEGSTSSRGVTLYSTALQAHNQNAQTSRSLSTWLLLFCRVLMVSTLPQVFGSPKQRGTPLSFYETENSFQINNPELILPEYIIMYGKQDTFPMPIENRAQVDKYSILDNLEIQAESEFLKYKVSLWDNLQPDVVDKIHRNESNLQKLKAELLSLKQKIREERSAQEEILRNFRNKLP